MPKVLFLDFDGVLHPNLATPAQRFSKVPLLAQALGHAPVEIVISSSWRFEWSLDKLRSFFPNQLRPQVVGITGPAYIGRHARWQEITSYCHVDGITDWRALDDARFEFPNPCAELIHCEGSRGLEAVQCQALREWIEPAYP